VTSLPEEWPNLVTLDDASLVAALRERMEAINRQPEDERPALVADVLRVEAELDDVDLTRITLARFQAWLTMSSDDVQSFSASLDRARDLTPGAAALRTTGADQTAARDLSADECRRLIALAPSFERALPQEIRGMLATVASQERADARESERATRRPFWKFWQR
jgi:hypothetical protein